MANVFIQNSASLTSLGSGTSIALLTSLATDLRMVFTRVNSPTSTVVSVTDDAGVGNVWKPVTDNSGNTIRIQEGGTLQSSIECWYCPDAAGITQHLTITSSGGAGDNFDIFALTFGYANNSSPVDVSAVVYNSSATTTFNGPVLNTSTAGLVLSVAFAGTLSLTIASGAFTLFASEISGFALATTLSASGGGTYTPAWQASGAHTSIGFSINVKADPPACTYSRSLTIDHTQCGSSNSSLFPCLVSITGQTYLKSAANGGTIQNSTTINGYTVPTDLLFSSDPNGINLLPWEIEFWDPVAGTLVAWVQVPTVSNTVNTVFYMLYSSIGITAFQGGARGAVWITNYSGVYHFLNGTTLSVLDSTSNANNGTNNSATATTGQIDGGVALSGSSQYVTMGNVMNPGAASFMWSAWVKPPNSAQYGHIMSKRDNSSFIQADLVIGSFSAGTPSASKQVGMLLYNGSVLESYYTTANVADGNWHYVTLVRPLGSAPLIYVDGVSAALTADVPYTTDLTITNSANFNFGYDNASGYFTGSIDEGRVGIFRSADWILTEYNNQKTGSTFLTVGSQVLNFPLVGWQSSMNQSQPQDNAEVVAY